ncbi:MAG: anhydro-N-acetylmuramic acid kinase [Chitinophagaceae bacterium]|nr:MAG: anhydro-N-acetylmuramic acid kinase [Chitinophagaceae bacterium]
MKTYHVIGLMSGSSLDGLDIAYCKFEEEDGNWKFELLKSHCHKYDKKWFLRLKNLVLQNAVTYLKSDTFFGHYIGEVVNDWIQSEGIGSKVDFIVSHGQTVFHQPDNLMTSQIGDGASIAAKTGLPVITDLRSMDIAYGGQGAPIVPVGEMKLFPDYKYFINLGGIANISAHLPDEIVAFDICPCNLILNPVARQNGSDYDDKGRLASVGTVNESFFNDLNTSWYYTKEYPKTLSGGFVNKVLWPTIKKYQIPIEDKLRTLVEHIVYQISNHIKMIETTKNVTFNKDESILFSGGGTFNTFLMEKLSEALPMSVIVPNEDVINYKEALIIAFLGVLRMRNEVNCLKSVTGATQDTVNGSIYFGHKEKQAVSNPDDFFE